MLSRYLIPAFMVFAFCSPSLGHAETEAAVPRFTATYYYSNVRCPSCLTIERLTETTIKTEFAEQLGSGVLEWRTINIDGEGNYHFVKDYKLYTKSVIISEMEDGKEVRWKNLPKVWELLGNEEKFIKYLKDEMAAFMAGP